MKQITKNTKNGLIYSYTFENFIVGNSNKFAYGICNKIAERMEI